VAEGKELPWDRRDTVITEDNIRASQVRYEAIKAIEAGTATPEQHALLNDLQAEIDKAFGGN